MPPKVHSVTIKCNILFKCIVLYEPLLYSLASRILVQGTGKFDACVISNLILVYSIPHSSCYIFDPLLILHSLLYEQFLKISAFYFRLTHRAA